MLNTSTERLSNNFQG